MTEEEQLFKSRIYKDKNGTYRVDFSYRAPTGERRKTCKRGFKRRRDAVQWQEEGLPKTVKELERVKTPDETLTMKELIDEYIEYSRVRRRDSTLRMKLNIIDTKIRPYFDRQKVCKLTRNDIREWQDGLLALRKPNGEPFADTYLRTINNQLSAILNYAVLYHNLPYNPVLQIERMGSKTPEKEREFWTLEEYTKFSEAIMDDDLMYYAFQVLFWCGIRTGELRALTLSDIDLDNNVLYIRNSYSASRGTQGKTKTKNSVRTVHMPEELSEELSDYIEGLGSLGKDDPVFPVNKYSLHNAIVKGSQIAGVKQITVHGLRHSHISLLMNYVECASVMDIAKRAGHKSPDVTMIYAHRYSDKDEIIAEELNSMMKGGESGDKTDQ